MAAMSGACTPITRAVLLPLPAERMAAEPSSLSDSLNVVQALASCGHTKPCTPVRLQNVTCAARPSTSSLLSSVNGEKPIGNTPASDFPVAGRDVDGARTSAAAPPSARRKVLRSDISKTLLLISRRSRNVRRARAPQTVAKLICHARQFAIAKDHVQQLFAVHCPAILIFEIADDLTGLHVDNVAGRNIGEFSIKADRDPVRSCRGFDALHLTRRHPGVIENMDVVIDAVREPNLPLVIRQGDSVARTSMRNDWARHYIPLLRPAEPGHLHFLDDLPALDIRDEETQ